MLLVGLLLVGLLSLLVQTTNSCFDCHLNFHLKMRPDMA